MHLSARFHWKWPPVLWYDLSLRKLIKEVYYDLKYNHFLNRAFSYFLPLLSCVHDLTQNNNNASCNDEAKVFSSSDHSRITFVYISRSGIQVLPTGIFVRLDVLHADMAGIRPNLR